MAAVVLVALAAAPAHAAVTARVDMQQHAWFWSSNRQVNQCSPDVPDDIRDRLPEAGRNQYCTPAAYDLSSIDATPITPGHLGVALRNGASDMRTYLLPDLSNLPPDAAVEKLTVELTVSRSGADADHTSRHSGSPAKPPATSGEDRARIKVCLVRMTWGSAEGAAPRTMDTQDPTTGDEIEPYVRQGVDCNVATQGKLSGPGGPWVFDLTPMARLWAPGAGKDALQNDGVVLLPEVTGPADSWTVEFHGNVYERVTEDPATGSTGTRTYVTAAMAPKVTAVYEPAAELPEDPVLPPVGGGSPPVLPPIGLGPQEPPPVIQPPVIRPRPTRPTGLPLAGNPQTPWYVYLLIPAGLIGVSGVSRALGREVGEAGANRVALVLRRRRLQA